MLREFNAVRAFAWWCGQGQSIGAAFPNWELERHEDQESANTLFMQYLHQFDAWFPWADYIFYQDGSH
jgi:hypothetical protein